MLSQDKLELWYTTPAEQDWNAALPIGNGRLGAMIYGNILAERYQLNEETMWNGGPRNRINPSCKDYFPTIHGLVRDGQLSAAKNLIHDAVAGIPDSMRCYEPLADLFIHSEPYGLTSSMKTSGALTESYAVQSFDPSLLTDYRRSLDLEEGIAKTEYKAAGIQYTRESIASFTEPTIVTHWEADSEEGMNTRIKLVRGPRSSYSTRYADSCVTIDGNGILMQGGTGGSNGLDFAICLRVHAEGGEMRAIGETIVLKKVQKLTIVLTAATTFREKDPLKWVQDVSSHVISLGWEALRADHVASYQRAFHRVKLSLPVSENSHLPTDERLIAQAQGTTDPALAALYFQFGRYLLLCSSRPGSLMPANLQGIWNQDFWPSWGSKYTININLQMNYWPVEVAHLQDCFEPFVTLFERVVENGRKTAQDMYGCRGFVAHHNTDLWADTTPTDLNLAASYWVLGGAWLSLHLWEHYLYGQDKAFLERTYAILSESSLFFLDFMVENKNGYLVLPLSASPENVYRLPNGESGVICEGCRMDGLILSELFTATIEAARILGRQDPIIDELKTASERLPVSAIASDGRLMEWLEEYEELEPEHRHCSHVFGLYPGKAIHPKSTPDLAEAARKTLLRRGDGGTGWSLAWKVLFWARLCEGERAKELLENLLYPVYSEKLDSVDTHYEDGGSYKNMLCAHPPFQIDGNLGGCAAVPEMLVQSHLTQQGEADTEPLPILHMLPALPKAWAEGSVSGLRARGGFELAFSWEDGQLTTLTIQSSQGGACYLQVADEVTRIELSDGESKTLNYSATCS